MKPNSAPSSIIRGLSALYAEERLLCRLGLLGILLGIVGLTVMAVRGGFIPPEGYIYKAASFDIALGIYTLTIILLVPLAGFSLRARGRWRWWSVGLLLYAYASENIQIYRGLDPRFTRVGSAIDQIIGTLLGLTAVGLIILFLTLAWRFFGRRSNVKDELLLLGIRYGCAAVFLAFATGFWMGAIQGATVGSKGDLLPLHAAGFHGLQAVPLVSLMLSWSQAPLKQGRLWIHVAGVAWLAACAAIAWQTAQGRTVLEASSATILAGLFLSVWLICGVAAMLSWRRAGRVLDPA